MKLSLLLPVVVAFVGAVSASLLSAAQEALPTCALDCLAIAVAESTCQPNDLTCICTNIPLNDRSASCISSNCTIKQALVAKNFTQVECGAPIRNRTKVVSYTGMSGMVIALITVLLRMIQRLPFYGGVFGLDDVVILISSGVMIPLSILSIFLAQDGLGEDIWKIPFDKITNFLYIFYFGEILYVSSMCLTKVSILFFYTRIFNMRGFCRIAYFLIACNIGCMIGFVFAFIFQCKPVSLAWNGWDGQHPGKCVDVNAIGWSAAAFNIILDIATIVLPLPRIAKLQLSRDKKIPLFIVFLLGSFVTVISCLRIKCIAQFANTDNPTWNYVPIAYWSTIEVHLSIIIASSPAIRALVLHVFPGFCKSFALRSGHSHSSAAKSKLTATDRSTSRLSIGGKDSFIPLQDLEMSGTKQPLRANHIRIEESWFVETNEKPNECV